jgi:hypothetical protein
MAPISADGQTSIETLNVAEVWEAPFSKVVEELGRPGSKARIRGQLSQDYELSCLSRFGASADNPTERLRVEATCAEPSWVARVKRPGL